MTECKSEQPFDLSWIRTQAAGSPSFTREALYQAADRLQELHERLRPVEDAHRTALRATAGASAEAEPGPVTTAWKLMEAQYKIAGLEHENAELKANISEDRRVDDEVRGERERLRSELAALKAARETEDGRPTVHLDLQDLIEQSDRGGLFIDCGHVYAVQPTKILVDLGKYRAMQLDTKRDVVQREKWMDQRRSLFIALEAKLAEAEVNIEKHRAVVRTLSDASCELAKKNKDLERQLAAAEDERGRLARENEKLSKRTPSARYVTQNDPQGLIDAGWLPREVAIQAMAQAHVEGHAVAVGRGSATYAHVNELDARVKSWLASRGGDGKARIA